MLVSGLVPSILVHCMVIPEQETNARKDYIYAQLQLYERHCAGWFFWTYKKEQSGDRGWSLRDAVASGVFSSIRWDEAKDKI